LPARCLTSRCHPHPLFTSPLAGEVDARRAAGEGCWRCVLLSSAALHCACSVAQPPSPGCCAADLSRQGRGDVHAAPSSPRPLRVRGVGGALFKVCIPRLPYRHCERSEAIQWQVPTAGLLRLRLAMTWWIRRPAMIEWSESGARQLYDIHSIRPLAQCREAASFERADVLDRLSPQLAQGADDPVGDDLRFSRM
jgi:hypothetical protein